ncbi:hypothetical protein NHX12_028618 [Muraenolepis orangiensis]|uniref:Reverse transcriptase domain-containing protein n=1 Tax=Muraenolepis orangiensis TaxID=630683 RepID=A0A9Q0E9S5_9TELE|nr:hypothetical protein NHX12_028618 [Muraenolepis orangiensis]
MSRVGAAPPPPLRRETLHPAGEVQRWLSGAGGVTVPGLGVALPYLPPFVSSLDTLHALMSVKEGLEETAFQLLTPAVTPDPGPDHEYCRGSCGETSHPSDPSANVAAVRRLVAKHCAANPAYQMLKARFLSCFTLPALLATFKPIKEKEEALKITRQATGASPGLLAQRDQIQREIEELQTALVSLNDPADVVRGVKRERAKEKSPSPGTPANRSRGAGESLDPPVKRMRRITAEAKPLEEAVQAKRDQIKQEIEELQTALVSQNADDLIGDDSSDSGKSDRELNMENYLQVNLVYQQVLLDSLNQLDKLLHQNARAQTAILFQCGKGAKSFPGYTHRPLKTQDPSGPSGTSYKVYKYCPKLLLRLWYILRVFWRRGRIPDQWRVAEGVWIPKEENSTQLDQFRIISLLCVEAKVFFSAVSKRLCTYLAENNYIDTSVQKGGISGMPGCLEHTGVVTQLIREARENKGNLSVLWLDLENAFGSIPHKLVQFTLTKHHVPSRCRDLIADYYSNFRMRVSSGEITSSWHNVEIGIITGCTISVTLFSLAMNMLTKSAEPECRGPRTNSGQRQPPIRAFMDDLTVMTESVPGCRWILKGLEELVEWARMRFKPAKSRSMVLRKGKVVDKFRFNIADTAIPSISEKPVKSLGKVFDCSLRDTTSIQSTCTELDGWLKSVDKSGLPGKFKAWVYQHGILPRILWPLLVYAVPISTVETLERRRSVPHHEESIGNACKDLLSSLEEMDQRLDILMDEMEDEQQVSLQELNDVWKQVKETDCSPTQEVLRSTGENQLSGPLQRPGLVDAEAMMINNALLANCRSIGRLRLHLLEEERPSSPLAGQTFEQSWQDCLAEVERCKEALCALQLSEEEVDHILSSQILSLIGPCQRQAEERLATLDKKEADFNTLLCSLRQESPEGALKASQDRALVYLDHMADSLEGFSSTLQGRLSQHVQEIQCSQRAFSRSVEQRLEEVQDSI